MEREVYTRMKQFDEDFHVQLAELDPEHLRVWEVNRCKEELMFLGLDGEMAEHLVAPFQEDTNTLWVKFRKDNQNSYFRLSGLTNATSTRLNMLIRDIQRRHIRHIMTYNKR